MIAEKDTGTQDLINRLISYSKCLAGLPVDDKGCAGPLKAPLETAMRKVLLELGDSEVDKLDVVFAAKLCLRLWAKLSPAARLPWIPYTSFQTDDWSQLEYACLGYEMTPTGFEATVHFSGLLQAVKLTLSLLPPVEKEDGGDKAAAEGDSSAPALTANSFGVQAQDLSLADSAAAHVARHGGVVAAPGVKVTQMGAVMIQCPGCKQVFRFRLPSLKLPTCPHCESLALAE